MLSIVVAVPVGACLMPRSIRQRDLAFALEELYSQTLTDVPGNMTMHEPVVSHVGKM